MSPDELKRIGAERRLIVENLINGVEPDDVARAFRRSRDEVLAEFQRAVKKIKSYVFERRLPSLFCEGLGDARQNKMLFLHFLERVNLATDPKYRKIGAEILNEQNIEEFAKGIR